MKIFDKFMPVYEVIVIEQIHVNCRYGLANGLWTSIKHNAKHKTLQKLV